MENKLNPEILEFWDAVKHHLCGNGLLDVAEKYPQLRPEIDEIRVYKPSPINMSTVFAGDPARYTGEQYRDFVANQTVTIVKTPLSVAMNGELCIEANGFTLTVPQNELLV
ncbi:MAG: hypothetical protein WCJ74_02310 [bacterium]